MIRFLRFIIYVRMDSNDELIDYLCKKGFIETDRVEKAFRNIDRPNMLRKDTKVKRMKTSLYLF